MLRIPLDSLDPSALRFETSAAAETVWSLSTLGRQIPRVLVPWAELVRERLANTTLEAPLLRTIVDGAQGRSWPEFLTPSPVGAPLAEEIAGIVGTENHVVESGIDLTRTAEDLELAEFRRDPEKGLAQLGRDIQETFDALVAPWWDDIQAAAATDEQHRRRQLEEQGLAAMLGHLHDDIEVSGRWIRINSPRIGDFPVHPDGLVLSPTAFVAPRIYVKDVDGYATALRFPVRGLGTLWGEAGEPAQTLAALIGVARARVLMLLEDPTTTAALARSLGIAPGSASRHVRVLREAGLVAPDRRGGSPIYGLTRVGEDLIAAAEQG